MSRACGHERIVDPPPVVSRRLADDSGIGCAVRDRAWCVCDLRLGSIHDWCSVRVPARGQCHSRTRLAPRPLEDGGMPPSDVDVEWQVAEDEGFARVAAKGVARATAELAHRYMFR